MRKATRELMNYQTYLQKKCIEIEKQNGEIWNRENWITSISAEGDTYEEARQNLLNKLSTLPGVIIENSKSGVKYIEVKTAYKYYRYEIHAHNYVQKIPTGNFKYNFWSKKEEEIMEDKWCVYASLSPTKYDNGINWSYRPFTEYKVEQFPEEYEHLQKLLKTAKL